MQEKLLKNVTDTLRMQSKGMWALYHTDSSAQDSNTVSGDTMSMNGTRYNVDKSAQDSNIMGGDTASMEVVEPPVREQPTSFTPSKSTSSRLERWQISWGTWWRRMLRCVSYQTPQPPTRER